VDLLALEDSVVAPSLAGLTLTDRPTGTLEVAGPNARELVTSIVPGEAVQQRRDGSVVVSLKHADTVRQAYAGTALQQTPTQLTMPASIQQEQGNDVLLGGERTSPSGRNAGDVELGQHAAEVLSRSLGSRASLVTPDAVRDPVRPGKSPSPLRGPTGVELGRLAEVISGRKLQFFEGVPETDGFVEDKDNEFVFVNADSTMSPIAVVSHEITHTMRRDAPEAYDGFVAATANAVDRSTNALLRFAQMYDDVAFSAKTVAELKAQGKSDIAILNALLPKSKTVTDLDGLAEEFNADLIGRASEHKDTWRQVTEEMGRQDPGILRQFLKQIEALLKRLRGKQDFSHMDRFAKGATKAEVEKNLEVIRKAAAQALARYAGRDVAARDALFDSRNPEAAAVRRSTAAKLEGRLAPHPQASEETPAGGDKFSAVQQATEETIPSSVADIKRSAESSPAGRNQDATNDTINGGAKMPPAREFKETERAYGGRETYDRAKTAGSTNLSYRQWVQVRTPKFKAWFGDWQALRAQQELDNMEPVIIRIPDDWRGIGIKELRGKVETALIELAESGVPLRQRDIGDVSVAKRGVKKAISSSADPAKLLMLGDLRNAFESSIFATATAADETKPNISAYEKLLAKIDIDGIRLVAVFSVERHSDGRQFYNTVTLENGQEKTPVASPRDTPEQIGERATSANTGVDSFIRQQLRRVNPDTVSKVIDQETGEPLVVYHGTKADFSEFDGSARPANPWLFGDDNNNGFFFATDAGRRSDSGPWTGAAGYAGTKQVEGETAAATGANVMPVYLSIASPYRMTMGQYRNSGSRTDFKEEIEALGYDGVFVQGDHIEDKLNMVIAFNPTQVKSTTGNVGTFDGESPDIRFSPSRRFYSQLARSFEQAPDKVFGQAKQVKLWLMSNKAKLGIKDEEIQWTGINDFLDLQQKVTKADVLNYLQQNGVQVEEVEKGTSQGVRWDRNRAYAADGEYLGTLEDAGDSFGFVFADDSYFDTGEGRMDAALEAVEARIGQSESDSEKTKYGSYTLPGGENYRELLLTLPDATPDAIKLRNEIVALQDKAFDEGRNLSADEVSRLAELRAKASAPKAAYRSSHWDEKNVLAHVRFNDRTDADGNKVLFIEELQSDWGQDGKKKGFAMDLARMSDAQLATIVLNNDANAEVEGVARADLLQMAQQGGAQGVTPAAPFVTKTEGWLDLGIKRMVAYAVEHGYDKIAFVNGEQSADRYSLAKKISRLDWKTTPGESTGVLIGWDTNGNGVLEKEMPPSEVEDHIGKELADRLVNGPMNHETARGRQVRRVEGTDLKVGGEGMKAFYDSIVPQRVSAVLKKLGGGKLEMVEIDTRSPEDNSYYEDPTDADFMKQTGFSITPEMREKVAQGQPLFSPAGRNTDATETEKWNAVRAMWLQMAEQEEAFQFPASEGATMEEVFKDIAPDFRVSERMADGERMDKRWVIFLPNRKDVEVKLLKTGRMYIDASQLKSGMSFGSTIYAGLLNFAHNNGYVFVGDPAGVSGIATFRRTENMLSAALKFGTTDFMEPSYSQRSPQEASKSFVSGAPVMAKLTPVEWEAGNDPKNIAALMKASYANVKYFVPEIENVYYDFDAKDFKWSISDRVVTRAEWLSLSRALLSGLGGQRDPVPGRGAEQERSDREDSRSATLKRSALTNTLLREESSEGLGSVLARLGRELHGAVQGQLGGVLYSPARRGIDALNSAIKTGEGIDNAFAPAQGNEDLVDAFRETFGVEVVPVRANNPAAENFLGLNFNGALYVNADNPHAGFVQIAGHELLHQIARDVPSVYSYFEVQARNYLKPGAIESHTQRLIAAGENPDVDTYQEILADFVGDALADKSFLQTLAEANQSKFRMFINYVSRWLDNVANKMRNAGLDSSRHFTDVTELREYLAAVLDVYADSKTIPDIRRSPAQRNRLGQPVQPTWTAEETGKKDWFIYEIQDKLVDLKRVREAIKASGIALREEYDGYLAEETMHGAAAYKVQLGWEQEFLPIVEELKMRGISQEDFNKYLHARHAAERNAKMAERNPNQQELDQQIADTQDAILQATTDKEVLRLEARLRHLLNTKPYSGTEDERQMLSGMSNAEAAQILAAAPAGMPAMADKIDKITAETRSLMAIYGLETAETVADLGNAYQHYVPLMREMDDSDLLGTGGTGTGAGFSIRGSTVKKATGSLRQVEPILANIVAQREQIIVRGEKAKVGRALYGMALSAPNPEFWSVIIPNKMSEADMRDAMVRSGIDPALIDNMVGAPVEQYIDEVTGLARWRVNPMLAREETAIVVRLAGQDRVILFNKANDRAVRLAQSLRNDDLSQVKSPIARFINDKAGFATRWISSVNTQYNPIFGLKNFIRDVQGAVLNLSTTELSDQKGAIVKDTIAHALRTIWRQERGKTVVDPAWAKAFDEFRMAGGMTGYRDQFNGIEDRVKAINTQLKGRPFLTKTGMMYLFKALSDYNTAIENGIRLAAFKRARDAGMSPAKAASLAKNLTVNFNRKGRTGTGLSRYYAFFNAAVQGNARIIETAQGGHKGKAAALYASKFLSAGVSLGALYTLIALAFMGDDWEDIPEFVRERDLVIPIGRMELEGANVGTTKSGFKYLHIPLALGFHAIPAIGRTAVEAAWFRDKPGERAAGLFMTIFEAGNALGSSNSMLEMIAPSVVDPFIQLSKNENAFGRPIAKQSFSERDPTPAPDRFFQSASSLGKGISWLLDRASGGTGIEPGGLQATPDQVDFVFGQVTGGVGRESLKLYQYLESKVTGEKIPESRVPIAGMFYGETKSQQAITGKFYTLERDVNIARRELDARVSDEAKRKFLAESPEARVIAPMRETLTVQRRTQKDRKQAQERGDQAEVKRLDGILLERRIQLVEMYDAERGRE
jgi:hypothetical protein